MLAHSFDTVTVIVPTTDWDLASRFNQATVVDNFAHGQVLPRSTFSINYFSTPGQFDEVGSWWTPPKIKITGNKIRFQFSLPKLLFGHSARHAYDLGIVLQGLDNYLDEEMGITVSKPWPEWQVVRLDLCYNFKLPTPELAHAAERQLSRLRYRGRLAHFGKKEQFPHWGGKTKTVKFYRKGAEMLAHRRKPGNHYPDGWLEAREYALGCVLRYEEEWRGMQLVRFCAVERADQVTAGLLLDKLHQKKPVLAHIAEIQSMFTARGPVMSLCEALDRVDGLANRSKQSARQFVKLVDKFGLAHVKDLLPVTSFHRTIRNLRKVEVHPEHLETLYDWHWQEPIDITKFVNTSNFCTDFDNEDICVDPLYLGIRAKAQAFAGADYKVG